MKLGIILTAALTSIGLTATPGFSQRRVAIAALNNQLVQAVCNQNWQQAIQIVEQIKAQTPQFAAPLTEYQQQLAAWQRAGVPIPDWSTRCRENLITLSTEGTAGAATPTGAIRGMW